MKSLNAIVTLALASTLATFGYAATTHVKTTHPKAAAVSLVCPVTGEKIASVKDAAGHSTYNGKTYYFCCPSCKPMFDKSPAKYVKPAGMKKSMPM
jgi:YHS domain-containing protein